MTAPKSYHVHAISSSEEKAGAATTPPGTEAGDGAYVSRVPWDTTKPYPIPEPFKPAPKLPLPPLPEWSLKTDLGYEASLVSSFISENRNGVIGVERYRTSIRLLRNFKRETPRKPGKRGAINVFSRASRKRLRFVVLNSTPLISQFGMTYHLEQPDGETAKRHLHAFLMVIRINYPSIDYLWILEFQKRHAVHFHLFLTVPPSPDLHAFLAESWHRIAEPSSPAHLRFHLHEKNFIPWDMGAGSYVCKYLDKSAQKAVPENFGWQGRFWGSTRALVPKPTYLLSDKLGAETVRTLCRHHESSLRGKQWQKRARRAQTSSWLIKGGRIIERLIEKGGDESDAGGI